MANSERMNKDCYDEWDEPTVPSFRPSMMGHLRLVVGRKESFPPLKVLAFAGIASASMMAVGGLMGSTFVVGISGLLMLAGNLQALVRS